MTTTARILVVDDDPTARATIEALLARDGYQLEQIADGTAAMARIAQRPADLVLLDVMMPDVDGLAICRAMKADPAWRFVPVILVTALDDEDDLVRGLEAGADEFLTKPLQKVVLRARVRSMLRIRDRYEELRVAGNWETVLRSRREQLAADAGLSARERDVLDLLLLGRSHEDIATVLNISARTSKYHLSNVLAKLGAESRMDLFRLFL